MKSILSKHITYQVLPVLSVVFGAPLTYYFLYPPDLTKSLVTIIDALLLGMNFLYYSARTNSCPKCKKWTDIEKTQRLESNDMLMPKDFNILDKYKCYNCGHVWSEYTKGYD